MGNQDDRKSKDGRLIDERLPEDYWTQYSEETEMITCPACGAINLARLHETCWKCGKNLKERS